MDQPLDVLDMESDTEELFLKEPRNQFQGIETANLCSLAGQYDNPIPTRFLAAVDCSQYCVHEPPLTSF